jgi:hypothetical protein
MSSSNEARIPKDVGTGKIHVCGKEFWKRILTPKPELWKRILEKSFCVYVNHY